MPDNGGTLKRATKRDRIVAELRTMIASGDLPRGVRVQQDDLAAHFETSITPVREALRQLEAEGLLVGEPHRGVRVSEVNVEEMRGVYVARRLVEPFAGQLATLRLSRRDITQAHELNKAMQDAAKAGDKTTVRESNRTMHFLVYEKCGVPSFVSIIENLWLSFPWDILDVLDPRASESIKEHNTMIAGLGAGDVRAVGASIERHLRRSYEALIKHLTGSRPTADPFDEVQSELQK